MTNKNKAMLDLIRIHAASKAAGTMPVFGVNEAVMTYGFRIKSGMTNKTMSCWT
ncbi:hypothetical protein [Inquilinus sp. CAU 1745]|uniref:hypothetical protein n=1 Tax=Inquilinus sp. CAU 1745 TaxID=3140369 RepID=UPI00325A97E6